MRVVSSAESSPILMLPLDSQTQLVFDLLNVLIGVASTTFPLKQVQFIIYSSPGDTLKCNHFLFLLTATAHEEIRINAQLVCGI